jgi:hypothetical protein
MSASGLDAGYFVTSVPIVAAVGARTEDVESTKRRDISVSPRNDAKKKARSRRIGPPRTPP